MRLVTLRPVFSLREHLFSSMTTDVRGYPLSLVKDLDGRRCRSNFHAFLHQRVGHAVEVGVEGDVVVDVDSGVGPLAHVERLGGESPPNGCVEPGRNPCTPTLAPPGWAPGQALRALRERDLSI